MKKITLILFLILLLAGVLRFWQLGSIPPSPDWDEAALGYNAYSILHTGRDEYGAFMPIVMRSFDDYKPALYAYLAIPSVALFGLNTFSVRLPSAVFGMFTILAVYFLIEELTKNKKLSLLVCALLAISPWHIQFSRIAFESNVGLSCNIFGIVLFLKAFKKYWLLFPSVLFFAASMYVYQSEKVFVPLIGIALLSIFYQKFITIPKKYIIAASIFGLILLLPLATYLVTNKNALARAKGVSVFSNTSFLSQDADRLIDDKNNHDVLGTILDNRRLIFGREILSNYLSHFDFNWLFITGDISRHHAPDMGLMYLWELPFLLAGIYLFLFGNFTLKTKLFIFAWLLITPIPASITTGVPHAVRTLNFLPLFQLFTGIGILGLVSSLSQKKQLIQRGIYMVLFALVIFNFAYYIDEYFVQLNYATSPDWQYGYKDAVAYISDHSNSYKKIIVSNQPLLDQSYMFFLFYLKYPPQEYQKASMLASGGFRENHAFGKYEFRPIVWNDEKKDGHILLVGRPSDFPRGVKILKKINYLNGEGAIYIVIK